MNLSKSSLLLIYTGGTIGMKQDINDLTLKPFNLNQIEEEVPEIKKFAFKVDSYTFDPLIDSSDVQPAMWIELANIIKEKYDRYDGFIVLHGTDTMAYSASALSFMLDGLTKPVIFTGSQLPIGAPRTDGKENLLSSVEIASAKDEEGRALVPEVCIYFDSLLLRGNRSIKINSEIFRAFDSPNYPHLAKAGISIKYNQNLIRKPSDPDQKLSVNTDLDTRVAVLKLYPGFTPETVEYFLCEPHNRAVILETYGAGNAPAKKWFLDLIRKASESGKIIINVTQCIGGKVNMNIYANGKTLQRAGVVSGYDITTESALAKLFVLLGKNKDNKWVKHMMTENLRGEISR